MVHGLMPTHVRVPTRREAATAWRAHRVLAKCVAERYTLVLGKGVNDRRHRRGVPMTADDVATPLVGVEYDDMWFLGHISLYNAFMLRAELLSIGYGWVK